MNNKNIKNALIVSTMDCILFHPLDTLMTRIQTNNIRFTNIYAGIIPSMCNVIPKITMRLTLFDEINKSIKNPYICGALTGTFEGLFITGPISFYKNNYQISNKIIVCNNLFKSLPLITSQLTINNALFFGIYKTYKQDNLYHDLLLSVTTSFFTTTLTYPIDTVRVNIQTSRNCLSIYDAIIKVKGGYYKGLNLKLMRSVFGKAFVMTSYEYLKNI